MIPGGKLSDLQVAILSLCWVHLMMTFSIPSSKIKRVSYDHHISEVDPGFATRSRSQSQDRHTLAPLSQVHPRRVHDASGFLPQCSFIESNSSQEADRRCTH